MRKWLNIKPRLHYFSGDEIETESEDDDVSNYTEDCFEIPEGKQSRTTETSDTAIGMQRKAQMRRGKSETLRASYIRKKDVRVMIGTWNVAGRIPYEDLDLDEWLCTKEPADMYILGFQEVVPLNAGNVLGAEDSRPIPKWDAVIRRTLNKSIQQKILCKSYSAPPSPPLMPSNPSNPYERNCRTGRSSNQEERLPATIDMGALDWPEKSLDTPSEAFTSAMKLRRVSSSLSLTGINWLGESQNFGSYDPNLKVGLKRVYCSTGNLGLLWSEQQETFDVLNSLEDTSDRMSEEDNSSANLTDKAEVESNTKYSEPRTRYVRIVSKQMIGIYISIWVCRRLRGHVNNLEVYPVGVGLMGYMGNKGSVSVSMSLFQTRLCFVCSHLTSGHKAGDQQKRNSDVCEILQRTRFSPLLDADQPRMIPSHDRIFWFGDLNYRLNMPDAEVRALVAIQQWDELMNFDQLIKELKSGHIFVGWKEGLIDFPPTYKYEKNSNKYVGETAREGEKKRTPAWCDRILWLGKGIRQLSYWSSDASLSDHRPVSSIFSVEVEVFDQRKLERVLNYTSIGFPSRKFQYEEHR